MNFWFKAHDPHLSPCISVRGTGSDLMCPLQGVGGTTPADVMQLMMVTQYLDMMKDVGTKEGASTIFIPHSPAGETIKSYR